MKGTHVSSMSASPTTVVAQSMKHRPNLGNSPVLGSGGTYTSKTGANSASTPAAFLKDVDNMRLAVAAALIKLDTKID